MTDSNKSSAEPAPGETTVDSTDDALSYEQARDELVEVVRALESGGITLAESLALWERGERLAQVCQGWLDGARARLERAVAPAERRPSDANG